MRFARSAFEAFSVSSVPLAYSVNSVLKASFSCPHGDAGLPLGWVFAWLRQTRLRECHCLRQWLLWVVETGSSASKQATRNSDFGSVAQMGRTYRWSKSWPTIERRSSNNSTRLEFAEADCNK
jgi:hypothetical protein